jgi:hypothetical protein
MNCKYHLKSSLKLLVGLLVSAGVCLLFAGVLLVTYSADMSGITMIAIGVSGKH